MPWLQYFLSKTLMVKFTLWLSSHGLSPDLNSTTMFMTRNFWQFTKPSSLGVIIWKVLPFLLMSLQITKTWNILQPQKSSLDDKPVGPNIYQISILSLDFDQDASAPSLTP